MVMVVMGGRQAKSEMLRTLSSEHYEVILRQSL